MDTSYTSVLSAVAASQRSWQDKIRFYEAVVTADERRGVSYRSPTAYSPRSPARYGRNRSGSFRSARASPPSPAPSSRGGLASERGSVTAHSLLAERYPQYFNHSSRPTSPNASYTATPPNVSRLYAGSRLARSPRDDFFNDGARSADRRGPYSSQYRAPATHTPSYRPRAEPWRGRLHTSRDDASIDEDRSLFESPSRLSDRRSPYPQRTLISPKRYSSSSSSDERSGTNSNSPASGRRRGYRPVLSPDRGEPKDEGDDDEETEAPHLLSTAAAVNLYDAPDTKPIAEPEEPRYELANAGDPMARFEAAQLAGSPPLIPDGEPEASLASHAVADGANQSREGSAKGRSAHPMGWLGRFLEEMAAKSRRPRPVKPQQPLAEAATLTDTAVEEKEMRELPPPRTVLLNGTESGKLEHLHVLALEEQLNTWRERALRAETHAHRAESELRSQLMHEMERMESHAEEVVRKLLARQRRLEKDLVEALSATNTSPPAQPQIDAPGPPAVSKPPQPSSTDVAAVPPPEGVMQEGPSADSESRSAATPHASVFAAAPVAPAAVTSADSPLVREAAHSAKTGPGKVASRERSSAARQSMPSARSLSSTQARSPSAASAPSSVSSSPSSSQAAPEVALSPIGHSPDPYDNGDHGTSDFITATTEIAPPPPPPQQQQQHWVGDVGSHGSGHRDRNPAPREKPDDDKGPTMKAEAEAAVVEGQLSAAQKRLGELKRALAKASQEKRRLESEELLLSENSLAMNSSAPVLVTAPSTVSVPTPPPPLTTATQPSTIPEAAQQVASGSEEARVPASQPPLLSQPTPEPTSEPAATAPTAPLPSDEATARPPMQQQQQQQTSSSHDSPAGGQLEHLVRVLESAKALEEVNAQLRRRLHEQDSTIEQLELERLQLSVSARKQRMRQELSSLSALNHTPSPLSKAPERDLYRRRGAGRVWADPFSFSSPAVQGSSGENPRAVPTDSAVQSGTPREQNHSRYAASGHVVELSREGTSSPFRGVYAARDPSPLLAHPPPPMTAAATTPTTYRNAAGDAVGSQPSLARVIAPQPSQYQTMMTNRSSDNHSGNGAHSEERVVEAGDVVRSIRQRTHRFAGPPFTSGRWAAGEQDSRTPGGHHSEARESAPQTSITSKVRWQDTSQVKTDRDVQLLPTSSSPAVERRRVRPPQEPSDVSSLTDPTWDSVHSFEQKYHLAL